MTESDKHSSLLQYRLFLLAWFGTCMQFCSTFWALMSQPGSQISD